jgi:hypothetical protein
VGSSDAANTSSQEVVKLSFNLPKSEAEALRQLANERQTTLTQTLRSAIADEKLLRDQLADEGKILLESKHGRLRELILPN